VCAAEGGIFELGTLQVTVEEGIPEIVQYTGSQLVESYAAVAGFQNLPVVWSRNEVMHCDHAELKPAPQAGSDAVPEWAVGGVPLLEVMVVVGHVLSQTCLAVFVVVPSGHWM
jgi:hypothetical protein